MTSVGAGAFWLAFVAAGCSIDPRTVRVLGPAVPSDGGDGAVETVQLPVCKGAPVKGALITDFSDASPGTGPTGNPILVFGSGPDALAGGLFAYAAPFLTAPTLSLEPRGADQALRVVASPGVPVDSGDAWSGFGVGGVAYDGGGCLDASGYSGVQFTIEGSLGTCQLRLGVEISQDDKVEDNPKGGSCALGRACYAPLSGALPPGPDGLVTVPFAQMAGGSPLLTVDATTITGVNWQLVAPLDSDPCVASFIIDDVSFFR